VSIVPTFFIAHHNRDGARAPYSAIRLSQLHLPQNQHTLDGSSATIRVWL